MPTRRTGARHERRKPLQALRPARVHPCEHLRRHGRQADRVLAAALAFIETHSDGAQVTDVSTELIQL